MDAKIIEKWLAIYYGFGCGSGSGRGHGDGSGVGSGSGSGPDYKDGSGSGCGYGTSYGNGNGCGSGEGCGFWDGSGCGCGYREGIKYYNKHKVFQVDGTETIITSIKGNIAKGFILLDDLTLEGTYVAKENNYFAHGETIKGALQALEEKIFSYRDYDDKIKEFKNIFNKKDKYKGTEFFKWHNLLTGSCLQGRKAFVSNKELDLEKEYSVKEFLEIVKGAYGWSMLEKLEKEYI